LLTKICTKCKIEKYITEFSKHKGTKDGYDHQCKQCVKEAKQKRIENRIYIQVDKKICYKCKQEKSINEFGHNKTTLDGFDRVCKECNIKNFKRYCSENPESRRETERKWKRNNSKIYSNKIRRFILKHPEKKKKWDKINKAKRKEAMSQLPYNFTDEQWQECKEYFNNRCAYCGKEEKLQREHFVSALKGGPFTKENIVPACSICNLKKGDRDFFEWYSEQDFYSEQRENKILDYLGYI
jgi:5-methylcytosine-specific restriction endonuclease McrA